MKNKAFLILFIINVLLAIIDLTLTLNSPFKTLLETNLLYVVTGSFLIIAIFNVIFLVGIYYIYHKTQIDWLKFMFILDLVSLAYLRCGAIKNLIDWYNTDVTIEQVSNIVAQNPQMIMETQKLLIQSNLTIFICGMIAFLIWKWDNYKRRYYAQIDVNIVNK